MGAAQRDPVPPRGALRGDPRGRPVAVARGEIYGPHESRPEPHNDLIEAAIAGEPTTVPCGDQRVELVYVRDVARALVRACLAADPSRTIYNVGADSLTYRETADMVAEIVAEFHRLVE